MKRRGLPFFLMSKGLVAFWLLLISLPINAAKEADWVTASCEGIIEQVLPSGTRVDCLTNTHAYEYDFSHKWAEAIGQALYYSLKTGKKAGIRLICKGNRCAAHAQRIDEVTAKYQLPITLEILNF